MTSSLPHSGEWRGCPLLAHLKPSGEAPRVSEPPGQEGEHGDPGEPTEGPGAGAPGLDLDPPKGETGWQCAVLGTAYPPTLSRMKEALQTLSELRTSWPDSAQETACRSGAASRQEAMGTAPTP